MKQRKDGRWRRSVVINGKTQYFYSSETTEQKAKKDIEKQMLLFKETTGKNTYFEKVAEAWVTDYREQTTEANYKKGIRADYNAVLEYFKGNKINEISANSVDVFIKYLISKKYSKKTISNKKCVLNMIMNYAVINRYIEYNPVTSIRLPNNLPSKKRELPSTDILKNINSNYTGFDLLPFFLLNTGCRKSEALAVRFEDIDFEEKTIRIHSHVIHDGNKPIYEPVLKTENAERLVLITDRLLEALPKKFDGFLFSMNGDGKKPLTKCAFAKRWKSFCKRYNTNVTAHQLRHAYATMLFEAGIEEKDAQYLMGHSDINLTRQIYTHIRKERLKKETADKINNFSF